MKKFILLIPIITASAVSGYGQVDTSSTKFNNEYIRNQYLVKAKNQKIAASVCLGGGIAFTITGIMLGTKKVAIDLANIFTVPYAKSSNYTGESILLLAGAAGIIASIPLFIASGKNKHKANLMVTVQQTAEGLPFTVAKNISGLTLSISL